MLSYVTIITPFFNKTSNNNTITEVAAQGTYYLVLLKRAWLN